MSFLPPEGPGAEDARPSAWEAVIDAVLDDEVTVIVPALSTSRPYGPARYSAPTGTPTVGDPCTVIFTDGQPFVLVEGDGGGGSATFAHGAKFSRDTFGTFDRATVASILANTTPPLTQVMGTTDVSATAERGAVALYIGSATRPPDPVTHVAATVNSTSTAFGSTTVAGQTREYVDFGAGVDLTQLWPGMIIEVDEHLTSGTPPTEQGTPPFIAGFVQQVQGQRVIVAQHQGNAFGWRESGAVAPRPTNGRRVWINPQRQIWGQNTGVYVLDANDKQAAVGYEMDVYTARDESGIALANSEGAGSRGYDVIALASAGKPLFGETVRGRFKWGYSASGMISGADGKGGGFVYHKAHQFTPGSNAEAAFLDDDSNALVGFKKRAAAGTDSAFSSHVGAEGQPRYWSDASGKNYRGDGTNAPDESNERTVVGTVTRTKFSQIVHATGSLITSRNTAPADASLAANEIAIWFDPTNGSSALKIKAKQADGTVKTATVALA